MRTRLGWIGFGCALAAWIASCGSDDKPESSPPKAASANTSPDAGKSSTAVPSLTAQEVDDLLAGRGLGMARAAELNGYPGPRHVLDLRSELELDEATTERAQQLFEEMQAEAKPLGARIVALEKSLGEAFASQMIDESALAAQLDELAAVTAQLRGIHLRTHIRMKAALRPEQITRYAELRGYAAPRSGASAGAGADSHGAHHGM